jgi:hypothetical protein
MLFYILTIVIGTILIILGNTFAVPFEWMNLWTNSWQTVLGVVAIIAIDGIGALAIRRLLPMSWFKPERRLFQVSKREHKFYNKIKIKSWKDKVPELGGFTSFHKNELKSSSDSKYLERFIIETNYGVIIHLENAILGFLICLIPWCSAPSIWIPIFAVHFVLSMLPVFILRYTDYTLIRLYNKQKKLEEKKEKEA